METIQEQIAALQAEVKQLRAELDRVLTGKFDSLVCRKLTITDKEGRTRIAAGTRDEDEVGIWWLDSKKRVRISATTSSNDLDSGRDGIASINLLGITAPTWAATAVFADPLEKVLEKVRVSLFTSDSGEARIQLFDQERVRRIDIGIYELGESFVVLKDGHKQDRIRIATDPDGEAGLQIFDLDRKLRIHAATLVNETVILPTKDVLPKA